MVKEMHDAFKGSYGSMVSYATKMAKRSYNLLSGIAGQLYSR